MKNGDHNKSGGATGASPSAFDLERERLHRQMLSSVSHDLKTPLASIIGSLEVYERMKAKLSPQQQEMLIATALQETYRLDNFITNILDMAKLENGMVKPRMESNRLGTLIENCLTRLGYRMDGVEVKIEGPAEFDVLTDPTLFSRAVCLLLDNAVKYGGRPARVGVFYGREGSHAYVRVSDNGAGVPEAHHETVFSKYTRLAKGDQQNAGTGLGLAICREIMRVLGGSVSVAGGAEGGAAFTLAFPIA